MKYAILIESKNTRFAALDRIAQIINPSVDLETFSFEDIKLRDIFSTVLCPILSLDPLSSHITNAEGFGESCKQIPPSFFIPSATRWLLSGNQLAQRHNQSFTG